MQVSVGVCIYGPNCCKKTEKQNGGRDYNLVTTQAVADVLGGIKVTATGCQANCKRGPNLKITQRGTENKQEYTMDAEQIIDALEAATNKIGKFPQNMRLALKQKEQGNRALIKKDAKAAIRYYEDAMKNLGKGGKTQKVLGTIYANRAAAKLIAGDTTGAMDDCEMAVGRNPQSRVAWVRKGDALKLSGNPDAAEEAYEKAASLDKFRSDDVRSGAEKVGKGGPFGMGPKYQVYDLV